MRASCYYRQKAIEMRALSGTLEERFAKRSIDHIARGYDDLAACAERIEKFALQTPQEGRVKEGGTHAH